MSLVPRNINFDEVWDNVRITVCDILLRKRVSRQTWNDRFSDIYTLCVARPESFADRLNDETHLLISDHLKKILQHLQHQQNFLKNYTDTWLQFKEASNLLNQLYIYFNQQQQKLPKEIITYGFASDWYEKMANLEIKPICMLLWKEIVLNPLEPHLRNTLISILMKQKINQDIDMIMIEEISHILQSLREIDYYRKSDEVCVYNRIFETPYLSGCTQYYESDATALFAQYTMPECLSLITKKRNFEIHIGKKYLPDKTIEKLKVTFNDCMLKRHLNKFESSSKLFIETMDEPNLQLMYLLLKPIENGHNCLLAHMGEQIEKQGSEAISNLNQDSIHVQFVEQIVAIYILYAKLIQKIFDFDTQFLNTLEKRLKVVVNQTNANEIPKSPEYLAKYWNELLKQDVKNQASDDALEGKLTSSLVIFRLINDKDIFQKYLSRMIAKRLLMNNPNLHAIEIIISKLKTACGHSFTIKLHQMYSDVAINHELNNKFIRYLRQMKLKNSKMIDFHVNVLQSGAWPYNRCALEISLPNCFLDQVQLYEKFYHSQFSGRKLIWLNHMGNVDVQLNHLSKSYIVTMQNFQYLILLQFEHTETLTVLEILNLLQINLEQFRIFIFGLIKMNILKCQNDLEAINETTEILLNREFSNKRTKFRIPQVVQKSLNSSESVTKISNSIEIDRKCYLEAAIVRVMKLRRLIKHSELVSELMSISKSLFMPSLSLIKVCIEKLIDGQYMERLTDKPDYYSYLA